MIWLTRKHHRHVVCMSIWMICHCVFLILPLIYLHRHTSLAWQILLLSCCCGISCFVKGFKIQRFQQIYISKRIIWYTFGNIYQEEIVVYIVILISLIIVHSKLSTNKFFTNEISSRSNQLSFHSSLSFLYIILSVTKYEVHVKSLNWWISIETELRGVSESANERSDTIFVFGKFILSSLKSSSSSSSSVSIAERAEKKHSEQHSKRYWVLKWEK